MKRIFIRIISILLLLLPGFASEAFALSKAIYDLSTDTVLMSENADDTIAIASVTKLMTADIIFDAIKAEEMNLFDRVTYSQEELDLYLYGSDLNIPRGAELTVEECLNIMLVRSANSSALALAKAHSGSETEFVKAMNKKAEVLGMEHTRFINSHGLPVLSTDEQNTSTVNDLILLVKDLINHHPEVIDYTKKESYTIPRLNISASSTNPLLGFETVDGLKTGTTTKAGKCLITTATEAAEGFDANRRIVTFLFGAASDTERVNETKKLLDDGLKRYVLKRIVPITNRYTLELDPINFDAASIELMPAANFDRLLNVSNKYKLKIEYRSPGEDTIEKGTTLGNMVLIENDNVVYKAPLVASTTVERSGFLNRLWKKIKSVF